MSSSRVDGWTEVVIDAEGNVRCSRCNHFRNFQEPEKPVPSHADAQPEQKSEIPVAKPRRHHRRRKKVRETPNAEAV